MFWVVLNILEITYKSKICIFSIGNIPFISENSDLFIPGEKKIIKLEKITNFSYKSVKKF